MRILIAYIAVVLLWSITPLAIKWSGEGPGYLFGVSGRMVSGLLALALYCVIRGIRLPLDHLARLTYVAGAIQIYGSMVLTYWASQHLPSGWLSVIFGLTPLLTAPLAAYFLQEKSLTPRRLGSYFFGLGGLGLMFHSALQFSPAASFGLLAILGAACFQSLSAVWIKKMNRGLSAVVQVTGSLCIAVPLYLLTWWTFDGVWPDVIPPRALYAILFLGLIATTGGFALYFYILKELPAGRVALINLLTPMFSLYVGDLLNHESIPVTVYGGTLLILTALILYEWEGVVSFVHFLKPDRKPSQKGSRSSRKRAPTRKLRRRRR